MGHLVADLNQVIGRIQALKVELHSGTLHPFVASPVLRKVDDRRGFSLVREKDFLERRGKLAARQLTIENGWFLNGIFYLMLKMS